MSDEDLQPSPDPSPQPETPPAASGSGAVKPASIDSLNAALPHYDFVELIGLGGMGAVYKAKQRKLNRFVAIKILPPIVEDELGFAERFEREAQSMASLSHPHIVPVYDFGETSDGQLYFVMEYVEGADLHQLIAGGQLTTDHFFGWVPQICDAIQFAHDHGIVHRDIKPANILIDKHGRVRMADFGLAKLTDANEPQTALTLANISMGTPDYAAPEQIDAGKEIDWRADIYSLGVVMYQMLTGSVPRGAFPMPSERVRGLDPRVDEVVLKAMQSNPGDRFQSAGEITRKLTEIHLTPRPEEIRDSTRPVRFPIAEKSRPKSLLPAVLGLIGASVLLGVVLIVINKAGKPDTELQLPPDDKVVAAIEAPEKRKELEPSPKEQTKPKVAEAPRGPRMAEPEGRPQSPKSQGAVSGSKGNGGGISLRPGPGNFASFKDKLGPRKRFDGVRQLTGNVVIMSWDGGPPPDEGLSAPPKNLGRVAMLRIGQEPKQLGNEHSWALALRTDGTVVSWGDQGTQALKVPESAREGVLAIAAGVNHALALKQDGAVIAWGANDQGQCDVPEGLTGISEIACGLDFSLALKADGTLAAWGSGPGAQPPADLSGVTAIAAGCDHALALKDDGTVASWGGNDFGQQDAPPITEAKAIAATFGASYAMTRDGRLIGWGAWPEKKPIPEGVRVKSITGSGANLVARDLENRLFLHGPGVRQNAIPEALGRAPVDVEVETSTAYIFIYRPSAIEIGIDVATVTEASPALLPEPEPSAPETEAGRRIADLQQKFEAAYLEQVSLPFEASVEQLNAYYLGALKTRQIEAAGESRLEDAVALREESERIGREGSIPKQDADEAPEVLTELRHTYRSQTEQFETDRHARETELLAKYDAALEALQNEFTQAQLLDDALEVKAFREHRAQQE